MSLHEPPPTRARYECKGSLFRGYLAAIERIGLREAVGARVADYTRDAMAHPPVSSAWIGAALVEDLVGAVAGIRGDESMRQFSRLALSGSVTTLVMPVISGLLRLFGTSPATLFVRMDKLLAPAMRGVEVKYVPGDGRSGVVELTFPGECDVPMRRWYAFQGSFEITFDLCMVRGTVSRPDVLPDDLRNRARYAVSW